MKKIILRFRVVDRDNFKNIKTGRKSIETRAGSDRYHQVATGDVLVIVCGRERIEKIVKRVHHFKTLGGLLKAMPLKRIMPDTMTTTEARKRWYEYPGYKERIKQYGIVAWELK